MSLETFANPTCSQDKEVHLTFHREKSIKILNKADKRCPTFYFCFPFLLWFRCDVIIPSAAAAVLVVAVCLGSILAFLDLGTSEEFDKHCRSVFFTAHVQMHNNIVSELSIIVQYI